tara:strand:- start:1768 stop:1947 length:180 start_codon:yes stop_codon:yes gene_type:complete
MVFIFPSKVKKNMAYSSIAIWMSGIVVGYALSYCEHAKQRRKMHALEIALNNIMGHQKK